MRKSLVRKMKALVTGGAGFIGSHLCEFLMRHGWDVTVLDNFSSGSIKNLRHLLDEDSPKFQLVRGDCTIPRHVKKSLKDTDVVFHFAANPEVRTEMCDPVTCFRQNIYATHILLECIKNCHYISSVVFASSSTVYGDASVIPTPEYYSPLEPISVYGASKLASEALIMAYAHTYDKKAVILRVANVVGSKSERGVICDFIKKLRQNPSRLEILGDGSQTKSFLLVDDFVMATLKAYETAKTRVEVFNVGSKDQIMVKDIAELVVDEMGLTDVGFNYANAVEEGRGWKGDVKNMLLDITRLEARGWKPVYKSEEALRLAAKWYLNALF
jgi:UDP-glucose 4-epimerase